MSSGMAMKFGPVTSAFVPFGPASDAKIIADATEFALANGIVGENDSGQEMADKMAKWGTQTLVNIVRAWKIGQQRTIGEQAARAAGDALFRGG